ncbi:unnamed protein product [Chrysoparadoxa australica]
MMLALWPVGWTMLKTMKRKITHTSRTNRFDNCAEGAISTGAWLLVASFFLTCQSFSCYFYTAGLCDTVTEVNSGIRHLNYSLGTTYVLHMLSKYLLGITAKQILLFRLRAHQSFAVVLAVATGFYSLYEYAADGINFGSSAGKVAVEIFLCCGWFTSITLFIQRTPEVFTPPIQNLNSVILDSNVALETLRVVPDGIMRDSELEELARGALSKDKGVLGVMLRQVNDEGGIRVGRRASRRSSVESRDRDVTPPARWLGAKEELGDLSPPGPGNRSPVGWDRVRAESMSVQALSRGRSPLHSPSTTRARRPTFRDGNKLEEEVFQRAPSQGDIRLRRQFTDEEREVLSAGKDLVEADEERKDDGEQPRQLSQGDAQLGRADQGEQPYVHPLKRYYDEHHKLPPWSFIRVYLREIAFFWRFMLFAITVFYKLFLSLAANLVLNRHWVQIFTPLSTAALLVGWLIAIPCHPKDRVSNQIMHLHFWFHALSEIPDLLVFIKLQATAVVFFWEGDLTMTRVLHLDLELLEVLVISASVLSGCISLYFFANRVQGVTPVSALRQGLEWSTMLFWLIICVLMAYKARSTARQSLETALALQTGDGEEASSSGHAAAPEPSDRDRATSAVLAQAASTRHLTARLSHRLPQAPSPEDSGALTSTGAAADDDASVTLTPSAVLCCSCWGRFAREVDADTGRTNIPVFRLIFVSATVAYFVLIVLGTTGVLYWGYATIVSGFSVSCVCFHWLISIEHPTSTIERIHLMLHALSALVVLLLLLDKSMWVQAGYQGLILCTVFPSLFFGIQGLKKALQRRYCNHLELVREAISIFSRSCMLLGILLFLAFEGIGCLNAHPQDMEACEALLFANTQAGLSVSLGFLVFLGMCDLAPRRLLVMALTPHQIATCGLSALASVLCLFSVASRHFSIVEYVYQVEMVQFTCLLSWYTALVILWCNRPKEDDLDIDITGPTRGGLYEIFPRLRRNSDTVLAPAANGTANMV